MKIIIKEVRGLIGDWFLNWAYSIYHNEDPFKLKLALFIDKEFKHGKKK